jgi:hypothetical protein
MYGGLTKLSGNRLVCVYKVGSRDPETGSPWTVRDETIVWTASDDGGRTWPGDARLIYADPETRQENCCGRGYHGYDGMLMHPFYILNPDYEERAKADNWAHLYLAESCDEGKSWTRRRIQTPIAMEASFGGFTRLSTGTVLLNVYGTAELGTFRHRSGIVRSEDDGRTWGDFSLIGAAADPDGGAARLNETDVAELPNGSLLSMSRTQYSGYPLYRGRSADGGRTWTVDDSGLTGLCPALCFTRIGPPEGVVTLIYHDRWGEHAAQGGLYIAFSTDEGGTWGEPQWLSPGAYPCAVETKPGQVFCTYYRDSTLLRGTHFPVPFPTGLRTEKRAPADRGLCLVWDRYRGTARGISYSIHRALTADVPITAATQVGVVTDANSFVDGELAPGQMAFYRVVAEHGTRRLGLSWVACGRGAE